MSNEGPGEGSLLAEWRFWSVLLSASLLVYAGYRSVSGSGSLVGLVILSPLLPVLGFIWFCDFWSTWLGPLIGNGHHAKSVDAPSPAWLIALFGWMILLTVLALVFA